MSTRRSRAPIWSQPEPGSRRPRFTRERIAEVALAIADREGFEALSMRRLADELGAGTMTVYHYIRTKDDLIQLLDDAIMAEVVVPDGELPRAWRPALSMIARRSHGAFHGHPWALQALQSARFGPNGLRHFEQSMAAVASTGLPLADRMTILNIVDDFVFGHTFRSTHARTRRQHDHSEMEWMLELTRAQIATGHYPEIEAILGNQAPAAAWRKMAELLDDDGRFEQGLATILDGIALRWKLPPEDEDAGAPQARARRARATASRGSASARSNRARRR